jgi:flagellar biosynthesis protein FlgN
MLKIQDSTEFTAALMDEKNTIQVFIEILKKEEDALVQGKIDDVDFLASDKTRLVEKLMQLGEQRSQYLLTQGYSTDSAGMNEWLAKHINPDTQTLWNELLQLAKNAKQINQTNGLIISSQLQHNQRAFSALQSAAGNISMYGPKGQAFI